MLHNFDRNPPTILAQCILHYLELLLIVDWYNHGIYNQLLLNILQVISQKYGHNL